MAKKDKNEAPNPNAVANRDIIHRLNFLYQASVYLNGMDISEPPTSSQATDGEQDVKRKSRKRKCRRVGVKDLAKSYIDTMKVVGTKTTVRMFISSCRDPSVKRTICKGCNVVLVPGSTASVRTKSSASHGHTMTYTCLECHTSRRFPAPPVPQSQPTDDTKTASRPCLSRPVNPRTPPLFARDAGHVVFRGEKDITIDNNRGLGNGIFIA
ncbi:hypothetical protein PM082_010249 [Marasmius tenuissimus]|nr:hypothetical protein PM082_010249 [Marasmius tenuissimus]